jgi:hypothetical protein
VNAKLAVLLLTVLAQPPTTGLAGGCTAPRHNRTVVAADWIVTTGYEYRGALGNVSSRTTSIDAPASGNPSFSESYVWDGIGNLVSVSYPECVAGNCFDPGETSLTVSHSREQGLETQVSASLGGISAVYQYHPNLRHPHGDPQSVVPQRLAGRAERRQGVSDDPDLRRPGADDRRAGPAEEPAVPPPARRCVPWPRSTTARRAGGRTTG